MNHEELAKRVYESINPETNSFLKAPTFKTKTGVRRVGWNRVDKHVRDFYTEITKTVLDNYIGDE